MKKALLFFALSFIPLVIYGQTDTTRWESIKLSPRDSAYVVLQDNHLAKVLGAFNMTPQRFKMYKTENTYNLVKLDTATGAVWQVQ